MAFYVLDDNNNKVEAFDKEGVLALLEQAIQEGTLQNILADSAFISKIKCCVSGVSNKIAFVSQATYNQMKEEGLIQPNTWYFITDDTTADDLNQSLEALNFWIGQVENVAFNNNNQIKNHTPRIEALESYFDNGTAKKARITNFSNTDIEEKSCQIGATINSNTAGVVITNNMKFWLEKEMTDVNGNNYIDKYDLGVVEMPKRYTKDTIVSRAYSLPIYLKRTISEYGGEQLDEPKEVATLTRLEIDCQRKATNNVGYYQYNFNVYQYTFNEITLVGVSYPHLHEREKVLLEGNYTLHWKPID